MRIFKTNPFSRFAEKNDISDDSLRKAIKDIESGLVHAHLGSNLIKQRIPRRGSGKSGGFRTIVVFKKDEISFFIHGFAKSTQENISKDELNSLIKLSEKLLSYSEEQITKVVNNKTLIEVKAENNI